MKRLDDESTGRVVTHVNNKEPTQRTTLLENEINVAGVHVTEAKAGTW